MNICTDEFFINLFNRLKKIAETEKKNELICPMCGCEMIKRKSKFNDGYWYGCNNYPRCKYKIS